VAKSSEADQLRTLYPATSRNVLFPGFNVNTDDLLSVGSAAKYISMLSSS